MTHRDQSRPKRFYLTGQNDFSNRGCEAIVRSTVGLLRDRFPGAEVLVPSRSIDRDHAQWPEAADSGVTFVPAYYPRCTRYWIHAHRLPLPFPKRGRWPFALSPGVRNDLACADAVLSVGGDNYSLDYLLPLLQLGLDEAAMNLGKPVVLWGASVGPFEADPAFLRVIRKHLARMSLVTARESVTVEYLERMGLSNVVQVTDPAFTLAPQDVDVTEFWPQESEAGVIGIGVSYLIEKYRSGSERGAEMVDELAGFVRNTVADLGYSVLLVPHVVPLDGSVKNNDASYLSKLLSGVGDMDGQVRMMDSRLNAAQIKHVIGKCRFFIGSRTHATIAALSSGVPTISIAYSVKARGINRDLFDHTDYVLETPTVSAESLRRALARLIADENAIRTHLAERIPVWQSRAMDGVTRLAEILK